MAENNNNSAENQGAQNQTNEPKNTPVAESSGVNTGEQVKTLEFTQDALNAMQKDARLNGENAILKHFKKYGITEKSQLSGVLERFDAFFAAEQSKETDSDKLIREINDHTATRASLEKANAELTVYKEKEILTTVGFKDEADIELYYPLIKSSVNEEKDIDFKVAAEKTFEKYKDKINKQEEKPKPPDGALYAGTVKTNNNNNNMKKPINFTEAIFGKK